MTFFSDDQRDRVSLFFGDAVAMLRALPAKSIGLIATDPAYEALEKHRARGTTTRLSMSTKSSNKWFPTFPDNRYFEFFSECYRVLDTHAYCYVVVCPDHDQQAVMISAARRAGFTNWMPLVWDKGRAGMGYHWRSQYENILVLAKGNRRLNNLGWGNVLNFPGLRGKDSEGRVYYPTEKPVELFERLIENSTNCYDVVCDPFSGSGACAVAATRKCARFVGADVVAEAIELTINRTSQELILQSDRVQASGVLGRSSEVEPVTVLTTDHASGHKVLTVRTARWP